MEISSDGTSGSPPSSRVASERVISEMPKRWNTGPSTGSRSRSRSSATRPVGVALQRRSAQTPTTIVAVMTIQFERMKLPMARVMRVISGSSASRSA